MTKTERIEVEVKKLNRNELAAFRKWFVQYDSDEWDRQIEEDIKAGKLDRMAKEALAAYKTGKTKEL